MPKSMENSNPRLLLSEILRKVSNAKTKKEKIDLLRKHNINCSKAIGDYQLRRECSLYAP